MADAATFSGHVHSGTPRATVAGADMISARNAQELRAVADVRMSGLFDTAYVLTCRYHFLATVLWELE